MEYIIEQLKSVMAIDSPTGFTRKAAEYTMNELRTLGYQPQMTKRAACSAALAARVMPLCSQLISIPLAQWLPRLRATEGSASPELAA